MRVHKLEKFGVEACEFSNTESERRELLKLFADERLVVVRSNDARTPEELKSIAASTGVCLENAAEERFRISADGAVIRISNSINENGEASGLFGDHDLEWHCDYAHSPGDYHGTLLYNHSNGELADLLICDTHSAYMALREEDRSSLSKVLGFHAVSEKAYRDREPTPAERRLLRTKGFRIGKSDYSHHCIHSSAVERSLVAEDAKGRQALYLSPATLIETRPSHAHADLHRLISHCESEEFVTVHRWRPFDIVLFDNRTTMHRRGPFTGARELFRIQFAPAEQHP